MYFHPNKLFIIIQYKRIQPKLRTFQIIVGIEWSTTLFTKFILQMIPVFFRSGFKNLRVRE